MKKFLISLALTLVLVLACSAVAMAAEGSQIVSYVDVLEHSVTTVEGHTVDGEPIEIKAPTCTERGWAKYDCAEPSEGGVTPHTHTVLIAALGHDWASEKEEENWGIVIEEPTCTNMGLAQDVCLRPGCGETRDVYRDLDVTPHEFISLDKIIGTDYYITIEEASCYKTGKGDRICVHCGTPEEKNLVEIPMADHTWSDWNYLVDPTCADYGKAERVCLVCNAEQTLDKDHPLGGLLDEVPGVAKVNANWMNVKTGPAVAATQSFQRKDLYDDFMADIHFDYFVSKNWLDDCYTRHLILSCPYCNPTGTDPDATHANIEVVLEKPLTVAHVWSDIPEDYPVSVAPTCTTDGFNVYLCSKDDADHNDSTDVATELNYDPWYVKTYTVNDTEYTINKVCYIEFLPALDHAWTDWEAIHVYTKDGQLYVEYVRECQRCQRTEAELVAVDTLPCELGGEHEFDDGEVTKAATCLEEGELTFACTKCGETYTVEIPLTDHNWDDGVITKEATKDEAGEITYTCTVCGETKVVEYTDDEAALKDFVARCYENILGRDAAASEIAFWVNQLKAGSATGADIVNGFINSDEYKAKKNSASETVNILYNTMLDREPKAEDNADGWVNLLDEGVSESYIVNGFATSAEFKKLCEEYGITAGSVTELEYRDKNLSVTQFVNRCYEKALNRKGEANGINYWCKQLLTKVRTPEQVAYGFVFSDESINKKLSDEQFVEMLYNLYMGRSSDSTGKTYWVNELSDGMTREEVVEGFAESNEFAAIVKSYGL